MREKGLLFYQQANTYLHPLQFSIRNDSFYPNKKCTPCSIRGCIVSKLESLANITNHEMKNLVICFFIYNLSLKYLNCYSIIINRGDGERFPCEKNQALICWRQPERLDKVYSMCYHSHGNSILIKSIGCS